MNTIKIPNKKQVLMIAHRGCSGLEQENTHAAFIAAGNRSYFGIETDIHATVDGNFIIIHDDTTERVAGEKLVVEETTYEDLRNLQLLQKDGQKARTDLRLSNLEEYIGLCKYYDKIAVLELKGHLTKEAVWEICDRIESMGYLENVIFISFAMMNLIYVREKLPNQQVQYLVTECNEETYARILKHRMDLDIYYKRLTPELVEKCHKDGMKVNCWTCDTIEDAERMISYGVDFITSNILE